MNEYQKELLVKCCGFLMQVKNCKHCHKECKVKFVYKGVENGKK